MTRFFLIPIAVAACALPVPDDEAGTVTTAISHRCPVLPDMPATLAPPADTAPLFALDGHGVQRYACAGSPGAGYAWAFVAPDADLYTPGRHSRLAVHHTAGPSWRASDGSAVTAAVAARAPGDPTAVPWLLLQAAPSTGDPDGTMAPVTWIQRATTRAGLAPPVASCNADTVGKAVEQPYDALYVFYGAAAGRAPCVAAGE